MVVMTATTPRAARPLIRWSSSLCLSRVPTSNICDRLVCQHTGVALFGGFVALMIWPVAVSHAGNC